MSDLPKGGGLDLAGFGKIADAIPKAVYEQSAATLLTTFEKLTAPITESTSGIGRYLRQKVDNMVEVEKAIATYTLDKAVRRAKKRSESLQINLKSPIHQKSFIKAIEEASKETDSVLHEMWANLLASQMSDGDSHPHFVETLTHFGPAEARLLVSLHPKSDIGEHDDYISVHPEPPLPWIRMNTDNAVKGWNMSCDLLYEFRFIHLAAAKGDGRNLSIIYRTFVGSAFLATVSERDLNQNSAGETRTSPLGELVGLHLNGEGINGA